MNPLAARGVRVGTVTELFRFFMVFSSVIFFSVINSRQSSGCDIYSVEYSRESHARLSPIEIFNTNQGVGGLPIIYFFEKCEVCV